MSQYLNIKLLCVSVHNSRTGLYYDNRAHSITERELFDKDSATDILSLACSEQMFINADETVEDINLEYADDPEWVVLLHADLPKGSPIVWVLRKHGQRTAAFDQAVHYPNCSEAVADANSFEKIGFSNVLVCPLKEAERRFLFGIWVDPDGFISPRSKSAPIFVDSHADARWGSVTKELRETAKKFGGEIVALDP